MFVDNGAVFSVECDLDVCSCELGEGAGAGWAARWAINTQWNVGVKPSQY